MSIPAGLGAQLLAAISAINSEAKITVEELHKLYEKMIYRYIAWLYALRSQLLIPTRWEHVNQGKHVIEKQKNV